MHNVSMCVSTTVCVYLQQCLHDLTGIINDIAVWKMMCEAWFYYVLKHM